MEYQNFLRKLFNPTVYTVVCFCMSEGSCINHKAFESGRPRWRVPNPPQNVIQVVTKRGHYSKSVAGDCLSLTTIVLSTNCT